jgi:CheY-like chemotaxis protein
VTADRPRVLLVDDIDDNLCALEAVLRPLGLILVRASSGGEAMKALLRDDFALILLDAVMPGLDGFATAARIRRLAGQVCELRAAADALTRAHQVGDDLSVGVFPPDACAR